MPKTKYAVACTVLFLLALVPAALGQTSKGFLAGNIADPNGAAVASAAVKITNTATGVNRETTSQSDGSYRFDAVDPGTYKVEVSSTGFKSSTRDVVIAATQTSEASFQLEVGNPTEVVTVTSGGV